MGFIAAGGNRIRYPRRRSEDGCSVSIEEPEDVPEVWRAHFDKRGLAFTFRDLHRKVETNMSLNTVIRALTGEGTSTNRVIDALSAELGISPERFKTVRAEITGNRPLEPFTLPDRANQLDKRERAVVIGVVNAILNAHQSPNQSEVGTPADPIGDEIINSARADSDIDDGDDGGKQAG